MQDLRDPVRRALVDLFLFQDRYLDDLAFDDPLETLSETAARRRADERWRAVEKRGFPMPAATHSIAVLTYWEARASGRNGPDLPTTAGRDRPALAGGPLPVRGALRVRRRSGPSGGC